MKSSLQPILTIEVFASDARGVHYKNMAMRGSKQRSRATTRTTATVKSLSHRHHAHTTLGASAGVTAVIIYQAASYFAVYRGSNAAEMLLLFGAAVLAAAMAAAFWLNREKIPPHQEIAKQATGAGVLVMMMMATFLCSIACGF